MSVPGRAKQLESVISICLLSVLFLIGMVIFIKQSRYNASQYGIDPAAVIKTETRSFESTPLPFEPSIFIPEGFEIFSKAEVYNPDNLYEKIDGKAPAYLETGFEKLITQRFVSASNKDLWMELYIYDMSDIKNAFSVYSVQKRPEAEGLSFMRFAYRTSNALYFVHGKYYIEIIGSSESSELSRAIAESAQKIGRNLAAGSNTSIAELAFFPQANLVAGSIKLYMVSAFGCEKMTNVFTAKYKSGEEIVTAFVSKRADFKEAEAMAESYREFLVENGAVAKNTDNAVFAGKAMDLYGSTEIVFTTGSFVGGIHEAEDEGLAERTAEELINKLNEFVIVSNNGRGNR